MVTCKLSEETLDIITNSAELVSANDTKITKRMYILMFEKYPSFKLLFKDAPEDQYMRLAEIISAYAVNIKKIEKLKPALVVIAERHVRLKIKPGHYYKVGTVFIEAMEDVLGSQATLEFIDAWREAYKYLSDILIEMEKELYLAKEH